MKKDAPGHNAISITTHMPDPNDKNAIYVDISTDDANKENKTDSRYHLRLVIPTTPDVNGKRRMDFTGVNATLFKDGRLHGRKTVKIIDVRQTCSNCAHIKFRFTPINPPTLDITDQSALASQLAGLSVSAKELR